MIFNLNYKFIDYYTLYEHVSSFSIVAQPNLPEVVMFISNVALADSLAGQQDYPFLSEDFLPERVLSHSVALPYFTNVLSNFLSDGFFLPCSDYSLDIISLSFFIYNVTFLHLLFLGFIFNVVILVVISLLLHRNLRVKRQTSFEQNGSSLTHNLYFIK